MKSLFYIKTLLFWFPFTFAYCKGYSQNINPTSYCIRAGAITGLVDPKGDDWLENAHIYGFKLGFSTDKKLEGNYSLQFGFDYSFINMEAYKSEIEYVSNWVSGIYRSQVDVETSINQQFLEIPAIVKLNKPRYSIGIGFIINYLTASSFSQKVIGTYDPPSQHPNAKNEFNASLQHVLESSSDHQTHPFVGINFAPAINFTYKINEKLSFDVTMSYDLIQNPVYFDIEYYNPYRLLKTHLLLTCKLN